MANTRDSLGDQVTIDSLINRTLTQLEDDEIVVLGNHALYYNTALTSLYFPNLIRVGNYACRDCPKLTSIELPKVQTINNYGFYNCDLTSIELPKIRTINTAAFGYNKHLQLVNLSSIQKKTIRDSAFYQNYKLKNIIINGPEVSTLSSTSAFTYTPIWRKQGAIYVPTNLVKSYQSATNWSNFLIADINDYPLTDYSTISDDWDTIINNDNYMTDYNIGDIKIMNLGSFGNVYFELVGKGMDIKTDGSGTARMTWVLLDPFVTQKFQNTGYVKNYNDSDIKKYLMNTIYPKMPNNIKNAIVPVNKTSSVYQGTVIKDGLITTETIWLLSDHEVFNNATTYEQIGPSYNIANRSTSRYKHLNGIMDSDYGVTYWLRSVSYSSSANIVSYYYGSGYSSNQNSNAGVVFGFCI